MRLYRVDKIDKGDIHFLVPRVPKNRLKSEDNKQKRICCSPSINGCISAVNDFNYGDTAYIYEAIAYAYQPSDLQVADASLTGEMWILTTTAFRKIGKITITGYIGHEFNGVVNSQYSYNFEIIKKEN